MSRATWISGLVAAGFTALTIPAWVSTLSDPAHEPHRVLATAIAVGYALAAIAAALLTGRVTALWLRVTAVTVVTVLGGTLVALLGVANASLFVWAICLMIVLFPRTTGLVVAGACLASVTLLGWAADAVDAMLPNLVVLVSVAVATALVVRLAEVHEELAEARHDLADLAVLQERERMSRELHDVVGGSATTISLKARLGATLASNGRIDDAERELSEIADLAASISRDIGGAVRDLRQTSLGAELAAAETVARAASVRLDVRRLGEPDADAEPLLAMIVRESVTNAVKHGEASLIVVTVEPGGVTIADDGRGSAIAEGAGIRGMRERVVARDGAFSVTSREQGGTVVTARLS